MCHFGANMDNVGDSKYHIENAKQLLGASSKAIVDLHWEKLHYVRQSFV